jgi:hypothetical protein
MPAKDVKAYVKRNKKSRPDRNAFGSVTVVCGAQLWPILEVLRTVRVLTVPCFFDILRAALLRQSNAI